MSRKLARSNPALAPAAPLVPRDSSLNKLFGTSADFPELVELDLDQVHANPDQPRRHFDELALQELAESIRHTGLLQPILVKKRAEGGYVIAAGERRWRAHGLLGKPTIFAVVTRGDIEEVALVENLQRRDLDALETAQALARLGERHNYAQEQLAAIVGLSKSEVSRLLALPGLPELIRTEYPPLRDRVTKSHLFLLVDTEGEGARLALWSRIKAGATIKELRAARAQPAVAKIKASAVLQAATRLGRNLDNIAKRAGALAEDERASLLALRERIDRLIGG
ncbi:ParB/RepB/Spo0J family partition protein [Niveispirillum sp. SYP-B3756]|uniref:ParB/RepB/Spo0J family partition protein n=1 Tax=Niveispirillum sp. SYP-B3756 TaxID=2662178 RepID=UPI0012923340|nr:ParB/RepB/Spo0J family partition protein [Niveispirillum sp. SYP-B3756]MQP67441.1 ParB/RepB/Spo0J family partition protein [Niveispirillum sp. SYP-B3756]